MMKNEEAYKEIMEMKDRLYELCEENGFSLIFMLEKEKEATGSICGNKEILQSMLCGFLIGQFDTREIREIFSRVVFFMNYGV